MGDALELDAVERGRSRAGSVENKSRCGDACAARPVIHRVFHNDEFGTARIEAHRLELLVSPVVGRVGQPAGNFAVLLLSLPCVFAGLRYARKALVSETEYPGIPGSPGIPTVAYARFLIAVALLEREQALPHAATAALLVVGTPLLGLLMISQTRYPKLSVYLWLLVPILVGLMIMPFVRTAILSAATLLLIATYVLIGPELVHQPATGSRPRLPVRNPCS